MGPRAGSPRRPFRLSGVSVAGSAIVGTDGKRVDGRHATHRGWAPITLSADVETLANGDVITEIDVLELTKQSKGGKRIPTDPKTVDEIIGNYEREAALGYQPPLEIGHNDSDGEPAVGWLAGLRKVGTRLRAKLHLLAHFAERVRKGEFRHVSPEVWFNWTNQKGDEVGAQILKVAVTNVPHQRGADGQPIAVLTLAAIGGNDGDASMSPEEIKALVKQLVDEAIAGLKAEMAAPPPKPSEEKAADAALAMLATFETRLDERIKALETKATDQVVKLAAKLEDAEKRESATRLAADTKRAEAAVAGWLTDGKVTPGQLKSKADDVADAWKSDPLATVARLGFSSIDAAEKFYAAVPKNSMVPLSTRQSAGADAVGETEAVDVASLERTGLLASCGGDVTKATAEYVRLSRLGAKSAS